MTGNNRIYQSGLFLLAGYFLLIVAATYWHVARADDLVSDPKTNAGRLYQEELRIERGRILDRNGVVLADTVRGPDGNSLRRYTEPGLVHVVGYHSARFGDSGMEAHGTNILSGMTGASAAIGLFQDLLHLPRKGGDIVLTIDSRIQRVAETAMAGRTGALVAMNPRTGEVLAMVSNPTFEPASLETQWDSLRVSPSRPLLNRATQCLYIPGPAAKLVSLAASRGARLIEPSTAASCREELDVFGFKVTSHNEPPGKRTQNMQDALSYSCNTALAELGIKVGRERLTSMARNLGMLDHVPFELDTEAGQMSSAPGFLESPQGLAVTSFGQGELLFSPLHLALATSAIANGGLVPTPRLVAGSLSVTWRRAMSPQTAFALASMMEHGVSQGWASTAAIPGVRVAGKTGTAELEAGQQSHAVFIAFAPVDNPRVAIAVIKERAGSGSRESGPVVKAVLEEALKGE